MGIVVGKAMTEHERWLKHALSLAGMAQEQGEVPVGAVVVYQDSIIGEGYNRVITDHDPSAHAEVVALRQAAKKRANYRLLDTTLYVTLEPCMMCVGMMIHARIKQLVFGAFDPKTGACGSVFDVLHSSSLNHRVDVLGGVMKTECAQLLRDFFKERR